MSDFIKLCRDRYSVRKLDAAREVEQEKIDRIIEAGMTAPTATNRQPLQIWVFKSEEALRKLNETASFPFMKQAKVVFAVGADTEKAWVRPFDQRNFGDVDASIAATQMMLEIHDLGLGTTWVGYFDADKLKELFPELQGYDLIALFPVGYPAADAAPSERHSMSRPIEDMVKVF